MDKPPFKPLQREFSLPYGDRLKVLALVGLAHAAADANPPPKRRSIKETVEKEKKAIP